MSYKIAVLKGDGIGPDVVDCTIGVLNKVAAEHGTVFEYTEGLIGGIAIDETGVPLPGDTLDICKRSDAVLLGAVGGAVGGSKWDNPDGSLRPEAGLLAIRKELGLFANLRPAVIYPALKEASPLKPEIVGEGIDILVVRELTGGIYFGEKHTEEDFAYDQMKYSTHEVRRIAHVAFKAAMKRNKKVTSVDKANVLDVSRFWRKVVVDVAKEYPEVELVHMYVDNAAMQLIKDPHQFDVIVTGNMFGDILSDEAAMITGSIGMLASASLAEGTLGLYEPVHGSAPDIAGKDIANPIATILSSAMMLRYSLDMPEAADDIEAAVTKVLADGYRTADIAKEGDKVVGTARMGELIKKYL
ncbi:MAG: 3-isopropylmalate dehydrogenase [Clostridia bacterium]|nr:3-isopropylmalate dehydrogenase [Clostridia bacterium]MBN2883937.1 3-isopropylmalate dehydrogenase [Clostridia bacterium]